MTTPSANHVYSFNERMAIIWRCVFNRCPRCSHGGISRPFHFPKRCPQCDTVFDRENGFLLSALPAVYFIFTLFWLIPALLLFIKGMLDFTVTMIVVGVGAILIPVLLFNYCKMLALALYYFFLPRELYHPHLQDNLTS